MSVRIKTLIYDIWPGNSENGVSKPELEQPEGGYK